MAGPDGTTVMLRGSGNGEDGGIYVSALLPDRGHSVSLFLAGRGGLGGLTVHSSRE